MKSKAYLKNKDQFDKIEELIKSCNTKNIRLAIQLIKTTKGSYKYFTKKFLKYNYNNRNPLNLENSLHLHQIGLDLYMEDLQNKLIYGK